MTTDIIELSKQAAEVLGVPEKRSYPIAVYGNSMHQFNVKYKELWLAEDSGRCAEIAADRMIAITHYDHDCVIAGWRNAHLVSVTLGVKLSDHNNDRKQAWRIAVLKAVIEQGKQ